MDLLSLDTWDDNWRDMLSTLRPQRFVPSSNEKVGGEYVNVLSYADVLYMEQNVNTMFSAQSLNFFQGNNSVPAFTSMDGHNHKGRKIPIKDFLSNVDDLDKVIDHFFEKLDDEFDAHLDFSYKVICELLYQLMGICKSHNEVMHEGILHIINGRFDQLTTISLLFMEIYNDPKGLSLITKELSSDLEEFVGNMMLLLIGIHALGSAIELNIMNAATYGIDKDADENYYKETIRHFSPITHTLRRSLVDWNGFKAGTIFAIWFNSANLDPLVFENPHKFDPSRPNLNNHFGFNFGPHRCVGMSISTKVLERLVYHIRQYDWQMFGYNIHRYPVVHISDLWVQRSKR